MTKTFLCFISFEGFSFRLSMDCCNNLPRQLLHWYESVHEYLVSIWYLMLVPSFSVLKCQAWGAGMWCVRGGSGARGCTAVQG